MNGVDPGRPRPHPQPTVGQSRPVHPHRSPGRRRRIAVERVLQNRPPARRHPDPEHIALTPAAAGRRRDQLRRDLVAVGVENPAPAPVVADEFIQVVAPGFALEIAVVGDRLRIVQHQLLQPVRRQRGVAFPGHRGQHLLRRGAGAAEIVVHLGIGRLQRAPGQHVMEGREQHLFPGPFQLSGGVDRNQFRITRGQRFGPGQQILAAMQLALDPIHRAVAADGVMLQLAPDHRQLHPGGADLFEIGQRVAEAQFHLGAIAQIPTQKFDLAAGRTAAVVADSQEAHHPAQPGVGGRQRQIERAAQRLLRAVGVVSGHQPEDGHLVAGGRLPAKGVAGELLFVGAGTLHDVVLDSGLAVEVRQRGGVAEAVDVVPDPDLHPELLPEIARPECVVMTEGGGARQIAVGLDVPVADHLPAPGLDVTADPLEERRIERLHDFVEPDFAAGQHQLGVILQQPTGGAGGTQHLVDPLLPVPQPDRIEMGVQNQMHNHDCLLLNNSGPPSDDSGRTRPGTGRRRSRA